MTTLAKHSRSASAASASPKPQGSHRRLGDLKIALLFIAPAMIGFVVFYVLPTVRKYTDKPLLNAGSHTPETAAEPSVSGRRSGLTLRPHASCRSRETELYRSTSHRARLPT